MGQNFDYSPCKIALFYEIGNPKICVTWSQNSLVDLNGGWS